MGLKLHGTDYFDDGLSSDLRPVYGSGSVRELGMHQAV